jgi:hypothetical protein
MGWWIKCLISFGERGTMKERKKERKKEKKKERKKE